MLELVAQDRLPQGALVTGATSGIGLQVARQLLDLGLSVYVGARDAERGGAVVARLGQGAHLAVLDVTDPRSVAVATEQVQALDVLVDNAGVDLGSHSAPDADVEGFRRAFETTVFRVVAVTEAVRQQVLADGPRRDQRLDQGPTARR